jgi:cysteine desulfurase
VFYADHNATSPLDPELIEYYIERFKNGPYANPNSIHSKGQAVYNGLEQCRQISAKALGARAHQIIFNSGASEGISQVFAHFLAHQKPKKFIHSCIEHSAVIEAGQFYQKLGHEALIVDSDQSGKININHFKDLIGQGEIAFACIMSANNETGVIQPIEQIAKICREHQVPFFSDTTQYIGKVPFDFESSGMQFAVCSGHKLGSLTGVGILLCQDPKGLSPFIFGGGQEFGLRGGTQNYLAIEGLSFCLGKLPKKLELYKEQLKIKLEFEKKVLQTFPDSIIIGEKEERTPNTSMIAFPGLHGQAIQIELESQDIFVTTSSACSDNDPHTSKVLKCMHLDDRIGRSVIRISPCPSEAVHCYPKIYKALEEIIPKLKKLQSF